jgi:hypothetical protein
MQVGTADRAARHPDDDIALIFYCWIGDFLAADVAATVPCERFHGSTPLKKRL